MKNNFLYYILLFSIINSKSVDNNKYYDYISQLKKNLGLSSDDNRIENYFERLMQELKINEKDIMQDRRYMMLFFMNEAAVQGNENKLSVNELIEIFKQKNTIKFIDPKDYGK